MLPRWRTPGNFPKIAQSQTPGPKPTRSSAPKIASPAKPARICCSTRTIRWRGGRGDRRRWPRRKRTGKPILLSVGYAACHWCHVMAHESFEDDATAAVMNELFVNIKVDREERPDIDQIYMSALHHLGEQGGWPLTMFLTPNGEPVWGGTYFPQDLALRPAGLHRRAARGRAAVPRGAGQDRAEPRRADGAARASARSRRGKVTIGADRARPASPRQVGGAIDPVARRHARRAEISERARCTNCCGAPACAPATRDSSSRSSTRSSASARAASTIISAAASRATRSTSNGWCRISRRCSTTTRSSSSCCRWRTPHTGNPLFRAARARDGRPGSRAR